MSVKAYQQALKNAGFDPGPIDGIKGPKTIAAIKAFQKAKGLVVDGIVGPKTTAALGGAAPAASNTDANGVDTIDEAALAAQYGFALATLNSDPDLKKIFQDAVAHTYDQAHFTAALQATNWYKNHSEAWRNAITQSQVDPATYAANIAMVKTKVIMQASQLGAALTGGTLDAFVTNAFQFGWDDNQVRQNLAAYVGYTSTGTLTGAAAATETDIRSYAQAMGVRLGDDSVLAHVRSIIEGTNTLDGAKGTIRSTAASAFPHFSERFAAGETLQDIASPYQQSMASLLEMNTKTLDMYDPTIRSALSSKSADGKPEAKSIWQFENDLRQDNRWLKTNNARDSVMDTGTKVLRDMGLIT